MTNRPCLDMKKVIETVQAHSVNNGYNADELVEAIKQAFIGWYSRSVASSLYVFCKNRKGQWCILASERGEEAADFKGHWNCPCGYLDFDEDTKACARRECFEEVGVDINTDLMKLAGFEDDPITANRQNITFRYYAVIHNKKCEDFVFSKENNEGKEVGRIAWIPIEEVDDYKWAFGHNKRITEIFNVHVEELTWYFWKRNLKRVFTDFWDSLTEF